MVWCVSIVVLRCSYHGLVCFCHCFMVQLWWFGVFLSLFYGAAMMVWCVFVVVLWCSYHGLVCFCRRIVVLLEFLWGCPWYFLLLLLKYAKYNVGVVWCWNLFALLSIRYALPSWILAARFFFLRWMCSCFGDALLSAPPSFVASGVVRWGSGGFFSLSLRVYEANYEQFLYFSVDFISLIIKLMGYEYWDCRYFGCRSKYWAGS